MISDQTNLAISIVRDVAPEKNPEAACMIFAAAIAGMRGLTMRNVKVGALFWPDYYAKAGDTMLSLCGGWGIASYSPAGGKIFLHDESLDDDGGFRGHTWVETDDTIIDLMHDADGFEPTVYDEHWRVVACWYRRPKLERLVKSYWRAEMQAAFKAGRKLAKEMV